MAVRELTPAAVAAALAADQGAVRPLLVDCRDPHEWAVDRIPGALLVPLGTLPDAIAGVAPDPTRPVAIYCAGGVRSLVAARLLDAAGYRDVVSVAGGIAAWSAAGLPVELGPPVADAAGGLAAATVPPAPPLPAERRERYARQIAMPEIGPTGQARLLDSRVLVVGAGGLGSPVLLYLAGAGVGTLGVVDFDVVDRSNLQRQVLHTTDGIGTPKVRSAARALAALDPAIRVEEHAVALDAGNVAALVAGHDVVVDGTDSFEARYLVNDACVAAGIPVVHASVYRFEGQVTVLRPPDGPCYRCLYPTPPPPELAPSCAVAGVLGVVPGVVGLLQATETLKLLLGIGEPLVGRLLLYDALDATVREVSLRRDPACPACGGGGR